MNSRSSTQRATLAFCVLTILAGCAKKGEQVEGRRTASEEASATVAFAPGPSWTKTVAIVRPAGVAGIEAALYDEFEELFVDRLAGFQFLRVSRWPAGMPAAAAGVKPDLLLKESVSVSGWQTDWSDSLIRASTGRVEWADSFRVPIETVLRPADESASRAAFLMGAAEAGPNVRLHDLRFPSRESYLTYLDAVVRLETGGRENIDNAVSDLKDVLREDSSFAPAWRGLARAYLDIVRTGLSRNRVWPELAKDAAFRALAIDSTDGRARTLLGRIEAERGDFRAAVREARRAVADRPNHADAWILLGQAEGQGLARYEPAIAAFRRALELDPASVEAASGLAVLLTGSGREKEVIDVLKRGLLLAPESPMLRTVLSLTRLYSGEIPEARAEIGKALSYAGEDPFVRVIHAMILARSGEKDAALEEVTLRVEPYAGNFASLHVSIAAVYALLGRNGTAVESLEKALSFGYIDYPWMTFDPNFDGLRGDSRFIDCMKRLKAAWGEVSAGA